MVTQYKSRMIIFDDGLGQFGPMTDLRAAFEVRTGMYTTAGRIVANHPKTLVGYWVPEALRPVVAARANAPVNELPDDEIFFCVNGRWAMPDARLRVNVGGAVVEDATGHVVAAVLRRADAEYFLATGQLHERAQISHMKERVLYKYPWDVIGLARTSIASDILTERMLDAKVPTDQAAVMGKHPVEVHRTARVMPNVIFDAEEGPIIVHRNAVIRPHAVICGPCSIGPDSTILDHAVIKANTVIGPVCKVGGEVGGTIFQGYANKSHDGHLGDSWVGKWVNFGAGTTNSNLLNTYGQVSMRIEPDSPRHRTGLTFLGAIVGDHVKTAIGTRLMTGTVIGTGAMVASTVPPPRTVRRFAWLTDEGHHVYRFERFVESMSAMMQRRDKSPGEEYVDTLRDLYEQSTSQSASSGVVTGKTGRSRR